MQFSATKGHLGIKWSQDPRTQDHRIWHKISKLFPHTTQHNTELFTQIFREREKMSCLYQSKNQKSVDADVCFCHEHIPKGQAFVFQPWTQPTRRLGFKWFCYCAINCTRLNTLCNHNLITRGTKRLITCLLALQTKISFQVFVHHRRGAKFFLFNNKCFCGNFSCLNNVLLLISTENRCDKQTVFSCWNGNIFCSAFRSAAQLQQSAHIVHWRMPDQQGCLSASKPHALLTLPSQ